MGSRCQWTPVRVEARSAERVEPALGSKWKREPTGVLEALLDGVGLGLRQLAGFHRGIELILERSRQRIPEALRWDAEALGCVVQERLPGAGVRGAGRVGPACKGGGSDEHG